VTISLKELYQLEKIGGVVGIRNHNVFDLEEFDTDDLYLFAILCLIEQRNKAQEKLNEYWTHATRDFNE